MLFSSSTKSYCMVWKCYELFIFTKKKKFHFKSFVISFNHYFFFWAVCIHRYQCSRRILTTLQRKLILEITEKQPTVTRITFWLMEMGNLLLVSKIIFVLMVLTDGTTIWRFRCMLILQNYILIILVFIIYISYALHSCLTLSLLYDFLPFKSDLFDSLQLLIIWYS